MLCMSAQACARNAVDRNHTVIGRVLDAENRRDTVSGVLREAERHPDSAVSALAKRAIARTRDSTLSDRAALGEASPPPRWPEPAWRLRYRALASRTIDCSAVRTALTDSAWPVRLRAADVSMPRCAVDTAIRATLMQWIRDLPADARSRASGQVSWHAAAHALVALAKADPEGARPITRRLAAHANEHVRRYAAAAARPLADTTTLRMLAKDPDANVREAALLGLSAVSGHADDSLFVVALGSPDAQVVRVAAEALAKSQRADARAAANAAFDSWVRRGIASARDVRVALLGVSARPPSDDRPPTAVAPVPARAAELASGGDVRLRVVMSPGSGGGSFVVRLRGDVAPITSARILERAIAGKYDGQTWHRVEPDFVIQGGSEGANEYVGSDEYFRDELGQVPHVRGTVGMSTRGHDTGDAQWFINLRDNLRLNGAYTVFAEIVEGIDVVDGILEGDANERIEVVKPGL